MIVECDRGIDLGVIVDILNLQQFQEIRYRDRKQVDEEAYRVRHILRLANKYERDMLPEKFHDEHTVLQVRLMCFILLSWCYDNISLSASLFLPRSTASRWFTTSSTCR